MNEKKNVFNIFDWLNISFLITQIYFPTRTEKKHSDTEFKFRSTTSVDRILISEILLFSYFFS